MCSIWSICTIQAQCYCAVQGYEAYDKSKLEGTSEEDVQTKVRLTALMTLGTKSTHELQFGEVQKALGLASDNEVEAWVVRAIGKVRALVSCCVKLSAPEPSNAQESDVAVAVAVVLFCLLTV